MGNFVYTWKALASNGGQRTNQHVTDWNERWARATEKQAPTPRAAPSLQGWKSRDSALEAAKNTPRGPGFLVSSCPVVVHFCSKLQALSSGLEGLKPGGIADA